MGIVFEAEVFRVTASPLVLELRNATFNDKVTGEKLFTIREAHLAMTVEDLYSLQLRRDISINTTDIAGAEVWVRFDENGKSNWSNLKFLEDQPGAAVNFRYESIRFALTDSIIHFGDLSRKISGNANNLMFNLAPAVAVPAGETAARRYTFDVTSTDSNFTYDERNVEDMDVRASGIADNTGAEITNLDLRTPIGTSVLSGKVIDWEHPKYDLDIQTSVDMTQASSIFLPATPITGVGNFKGKVSGEGETYHIEGEADSEALRAGGVYLKALNVNATVAGINSSYEANGKAIAEMLTFEDFRIDWLKMAGNIRGTGTDFTWLGDLQAAAASSNKLSLGELFLADARAEYKDRQLRASAPNGRPAMTNGAVSPSRRLTSRAPQLGSASRRASAASPATRVSPSSATTDGIAFPREPSGSASVVSVVTAAAVHVVPRSTPSRLPIRVLLVAHHRRSDRVPGPILW